MTNGKIMIDSCVLLDILTEDPMWGAWSSEQVEKLADRSILVINPIIYGEISIRFETVEELEEALSPEMFNREDIPYEAAFLAGKCFLRYRKAGGSKRSTLPDFFIGAHALVGGMSLLTRDKRRYREYFPALKLVAP
jgi:hypothetical protein